MPTAVVSGRVDVKLKRQVDAILSTHGTTANDVIGAVWEQIAQTHEVPMRIKPEEAERLARQRAKFAEFEKFLETLPPINPEYANMTDDEILAMRIDEYV